MMTTAHYTGGTGGYGTMVIECADCGEIVAEYNCDENGKPINCIFDIRDTHECPEETEEEDEEEEQEEECENYEHEDEENEDEIEIIDFDKE